MATRKQAEKILAGLGLELSAESDFSRHYCPQGDACIDAVGRMSFGPDCRGHVVIDYTAKSPEFWQMVIDEAKDIAPTLTPCPWPEGDCEFHDPEDEED